MSNLLLSTFNFKVNKSGITNAEKYPLLVGSTFTMNLVTQENRLYTVEVFFNSSIESPQLCVYENDQLIQGDTIISSYPTNLLLCKELNDYGLFYDKVDSVFKFYKLENWYNNSKISYYDRIEMFKKREM